VRRRYSVIATLNLNGNMGCSEFGQVIIDDM